MSVIQSFYLLLGTYKYIHLHVFIKYVKQLMFILSLSGYHLHFVVPKTMQSVYLNCSKNGKIVIVVNLQYPVTPDVFQFFYFSWQGGIIVCGQGNQAGLNVILSFSDTISPLPIFNVAAKTEISFTVVVINNQYITPGLFLNSFLHFCISL